MSSSAGLSAGLGANLNEAEHTSEQNLRCFGASAPPHSMQVFDIGDCTPCQARLGVGSAEKSD
jgi:hypothetical protein